jgi:PAS domain-containing protein
MAAALAGDPHVGWVGSGPSFFSDLRLKVTVLKSYNEVLVYQQALQNMDLRNDLSFFHLLAESYRRLIGQSLTPEGMTAEEGMRWLYEDASFGILAHNTASDPVFVYGNRAAQQLFGYEWEELTVLPSRLSAEAPERAQRQQFLERVARDGFITGYDGIRIAKSGRRFRIKNATVWQLIDAAGTYCGQAAMLPDTVDV